jgi:hypothetical protein
MNRTILFAAALALLASPVFAQTNSQAPARTPARAADQGAPAVKGPNDVYCSGKYLGSDPDPKVRLQLLKDAGHCD